MNTVNYPILELLKYKIEFLDCLEFALPFYQVDKENIQSQLEYLKKELEEGAYKEITSSLFTDTTEINKPFKDFLNKYKAKTIEKLIDKKNFVKYYEDLIEISESFNIIINCFTMEEEIRSNLDPKILELIDLSKEHFSNFLLFASFSLFIDTSNLKLIRIINFCDNDKSIIAAMKSRDEKLMNNKLNDLSLKCINLEKKRSALLKSIIDMIDNISKE